VLHSALFDGARYTRHLEAAFDLMWRHRGEPRQAPPLFVASGISAAATSAMAPDPSR